MARVRRSPAKVPMALQLALVAEDDAEVGAADGLGADRLYFAPHADKRGIAAEERAARPSRNGGRPATQPAFQAP
jgi:hypothetical protein